MKLKPIVLFLLIFLAGNFSDASGQVIESDSDQQIEQRPEEFLGLNLRPEIRAIVNEIERISGRDIYSKFIDLDAFVLGSSYISEDGMPVILVDYDLGTEPGKLEAVITHELLHLRLRVNGYPTFLFSESVKTARGRAIDTEQDHVNEVLSLIEHQIFKADMQRFDLYKYIDLAGDTAAIARKNRGKKDGQADSINYARAILEYPNAKDVDEVRRIYTANKWTRALRDGDAIAGFIKTSNIRTAKEVDAVFVKCLSQLFPLPGSAYIYKLERDPNKEVGRRMIVSISRKPQVKSRSKKG
jgi:hypothetical protein